MQTRLLASLAGGCFGVLVASPIGTMLGLGVTEGMIGCSLLGIILGYAASTLFDVFAEAPQDVDNEAR